MAIFIGAGITSVNISKREKQKVRKTWNLLAIGANMGNPICLCLLMVSTPTRWMTCKKRACKLWACLSAAKSLILNVTGPGKLLWRLFLWETLYHHIHEY